LPTTGSAIFWRPINDTSGRWVRDGEPLLGLVEAAHEDKLRTMEAVAADAWRYAMIASGGAPR
jgi:hypothetical protein